MSKLISRLIRATFTITRYQEEQINEYHERTGLLKSEIVRRALDEFFEREARKAEKALYTGEQVRELREIARAKGQSLVAYLRKLADRERNRFFKRY